MVHESPASAKPALRLAMRAHRKALKAEAPDAAERAAAHAPQSLSRFRIIASYCPQGGEIDPNPLARQLLETPGARLVLPRASERQAALVFHAFAPDDALETDAWGVPAPLASAPILTPDLMIVPLLAFDRRGGRMGQGAGCYDRAIAALRQAGRVFVLGLAHAGQEVARVPLEPHDQTLDAILTEKGYIPIEQDF